jgi:hypothetical protein
MRRDTRTYLWDIQAAANAIEHARVLHIIETSLPGLRATVSALIDELGTT